MVGVVCTVTTVPAGRYTTLPTTTCPFIYLTLCTDVPLSNVSINEPAEAFTDIIMPFIDELGIGTEVKQVTPVTVTVKGILFEVPVSLTTQTLYTPGA